jgi:hypothetical protein
MVTEATRCNSIIRLGSLSKLLSVLSAATKRGNLLLSNRGPTVDCVTSRMSGNGLFRPSGVMSQYLQDISFRSGKRAEETKKKTKNKIL